MSVSVIWTLKQCLLFSYQTHAVVLLDGRMHYLCSLFLYFSNRQIERVRHQHWLTQGLTFADELFAAFII